MSHEVLRDLREVGSDGSPRVRGPVRDRVSTQPEPDQGKAGKPARRSLLWRIAASIILVAILVGIGVLIARPAKPNDCAGLLRQAEYSSDMGTLIAEAGCEDLDPTVRP